MPPKLQIEDTPVRKNSVQYATTAYSASLSSGGTQWDIVEKYLPLVRSLVSRMRIYFPEGVDTEDIYSIGIAGLIAAVRNYDAAKGKSFGSYAKIRVKGALLDELRRLDWLSRDDRISTKKYKQAVEELEQRLNRAATDEEICVELGITPREHSRIQELKTPITYIPLDAPFGTGEVNAPLWHELVSDPTELTGLEVTENNELVEMLRSCLEDLEEMPKKVLAMYYLEGMRLAEIAITFKLTESRICQIHARALTQLRFYLKQKISQ